MEISGLDGLRGGAKPSSGNQAGECWESEQSPLVLNQEAPACSRKQARPDCSHTTHDSPSTYIALLGTVDAGWALQGNRPAGQF